MNVRYMNIDNDLKINIGFDCIYLIFFTLIMLVAAL
jgi:hypothetical protein